MLLAGHFLFIIISGKHLLYHNIDFTLYCTLLLLAYHTNLVAIENNFV